MLSQVEPGEIRAALPGVASRRAGAVLGRPRRPRPRAPARAHALAEPALLRLLRDDRLRAGRSRGAPHRGAQPGRDPLAHLARAPGARGADRRLAAAARRPAGGVPRPHRGHRVDRSARGRDRGALACSPTGACSSCSEHAHSVGEKAARLLELELRKVPTDDEFRMRPDLLGADDACAVIATIGTTGMASVDPVPEIAERCAARRGLAPRRRGLRGLGGDLPGAAAPLRGLGAGRLDRREPAQVARRSDGLLRPLDAASGRLPARVQPRARVPAVSRRRA